PPPGPTPPGGRGPPRQPRPRRVADSRRLSLHLRRLCPNVVQLPRRDPNVDTTFHFEWLRMLSTGRWSMSARLQRSRRRPRPSVTRLDLVPELGVASGTVALTGAVHWAMLPLL